MPRRRAHQSPPPQPQREWMALIRALAKIDWKAYGFYAFIIGLYVLYCFYLFVEILRLWVAATPTGVEHAFQAVIWDSFFPSGSIRRPPVSLQDLALVQALLLALFEAAIPTWMLVRYLRGALAMDAYRRSPSPDRILWNQLFRAKWPDWMVMSPPIVNPSPTTILDLTHASEEAHHPLSEDLYQVIASSLQDASADSSIRYHLTLEEYFTVTIEETDGKHETMTIENQQQAALLVYPGLQPPGTWIPRDHFMSKVYETPDRSLFATHIHRINEQLTARAREAGMLPADDQEKAPVKLSLFEHDEKTHAWRLNPACEVTIFPGLDELASQMPMLREHPELLSLEQVHALFQRAEHLAERYGEGLLAGHQEYESLWSWARRAHLISRDRWLETLTELARVSGHVLDQRPLRAEEREQLQREAVEVYRWKAMAALGRLPKIEEGEPALRECLALCYQLKDLAMGVEVFQAFSRRMQYLDYRWQPAPETVHLWPEVTSRPKSRRSRAKKPPWLA